MDAAEMFVWWKHPRWFAPRPLKEVLGKLQG
jgi:hypothetical protein